MNPDMHPLPQTSHKLLFRPVLLLVAGSALGIVLSGTPAHADNATAETPAPGTLSWDWSKLDWKTREQLSPQQRATLPTACCGAFIQPDMQTSKSASGAPATDDISISGASSQTTKDSTIMTGDVVLEQGQRRISGDNAELFNEPQGVRLQGNVLFREPGFLLQGSDASVDLEHNTLEIENARFVLHEQRVHGEAEKIQRDAEGVITLTNNTYSSCTPGDELWFLKSSSMVLDAANGQGKATNVRIEILDVPIFYVPYLLFPVGGQRHSGFLAPSFISSGGSVDISVPYYFNLAPDYDATLIPRYIAERGSQIGGEFRYLAPSFNGSTSATWLSDQKTNEDRWLLAIKQSGGQQHPWSTNIDITRVSDNHYFDDLDNSGLSVSRSTNLQQHGIFGYMTDHWDNSIEVLEYQTLRDSLLSDPYQELPKLSATANYYLGNGFSTQLSQSVVRFDHHDQNQVTGDRLNGDYRLDWRSNWQAGYIVPALEFHYLEQELINSTGNSNPVVAIPAANVDMGLVFVRSTEHYEQTLEPRIHYNYTTYKNQNDFQLFDTDEMSFGYSQLFRDYRFSGNDRIGNANQTSLGLTSRWIDHASGTEWLQIGAGKIFYYEDRKVTAYDPATFALLPTAVQREYTNGQSPIVSSLQWSINPQWRLNSELIWSEESQNTKTGNMFLHYQGSEGELFSIGYRHIQLLEWTGAAYTQSTARQGDISSFIPVTDQWALVGRVFYDFTNNRKLEALAGFQYEDCCWRLRTVYRNWSTNPDEVYDVTRHHSENGIYIEFQFKNLAGVGTKTNNMLKDSIYGYDKNE